MQTYTKSIQSCVQSCKLLAQQKLTWQQRLIKGNNRNSKKGVKYVQG